MGLLSSGAPILTCPSPVESSSPEPVLPRSGCRRLSSPGLSLAILLIRDTDSPGRKAVIDGLIVILFPALAAADLGLLSDFAKTMAVAGAAVVLFRWIRMPPVMG